MTEAARLLSSQIIKTIPCSYPCTRRSDKLLLHPCKTVSASRRSDSSLISKRKSRTPRRLITISPADGRWDMEWNCDYQFSLRELRLEDLVEDGQKDTLVSINLCVQKHASFGFSVDGRINTTIASRCSNCSSPYSREIHSTFNVWVLPYGKSNRSSHMPEIGWEDPSVIYVKPGCIADLDSVVQDTIRLDISVNDTCSKSCEESESTLQVLADTGGRDAASFDKRWSKLLELKELKIAK